MAESVTQDESLSLYLYLCQYIVGTEEHVKTLRMLNTVRDNLSYDNDMATITSGSRGEGIEMQGSDLDIMRPIRYIEVCENTNIRFDPDKTYFIIVTEDTQPGFTQLRLAYIGHGKSLKILEQCDRIGDEYYFSNSKFKYQFSGNLWSTVHGPCLSDKGGLYDMAYCLHSKSWVTQAKQWITRPNNSWPGYDVKQAIIKHGVLFVPIGSMKEDLGDLEWRISFSVGEKLLMYTFTHTQLLCYALMKIMLKDVINPLVFKIDKDCGKLLCSYFLKTIVFWISEELPPSIWKPERMISCFMRCFNRLIYCVEYSICPHFFVPCNNLFENKIKGPAQKIILDQLRSLNCCDWQCILLSNQLKNFLNFQFHFSRELSYSQVDTVKKLLFSMIQTADGVLPTCNFKKGIHRLFSSKSSKIRYLYSYYLSKFCYKSKHFVQFNDKSGNKNMYRQSNACVSTLLRGMGHDAVSGWLMLASFFYRTNQYDKALNIIEHSLLKCSPEKLFQYKHLSHVQSEFLSLHLFKKMNIVKLWKFLILDYVIFAKNSEIIATELQIDVKKTEYLIPPVQFAHFLRFLCHYNLHNTTQLLESTRNLQRTIQEDYFLALYIERAVCYNMLGISFQMAGDTDSARLAFINSIVNDPDEYCNTAFHRLSLIR